MKKQKDASKTTTVTVENTQSEQLTTAEEQILRMRSGAALKPNEELGSKLDGLADEHRADVAARLALIQAEIMAALDEEPELREDRKKRIVDALRETD